MKAKPWQIAVIVVGLLGAAALLAWSLFGGEEQIPDSYLLIDVESGQIYRVNRNNVRVSLPAVHPETGRRSLIGVSQDEKGYYVEDRDLSILRLIDEGVINNAVDNSTGELKVTPKPPIRYRKPS